MYTAPHNHERAAALATASLMSDLKKICGETLQHRQERYSRVVRRVVRGSRSPAFPDPEGRQSVCHIYHGARASSLVSAKAEGVTTLDVSASVGEPSSRNINSLVMSNNPLASAICDQRVIGEALLVFVSCGSHVKPQCATVTPPAMDEGKDEDEDISPNDFTNQLLKTCARVQAMMLTQQRSTQESAHRDRFCPQCGASAHGDGVAFDQSWCTDGLCDSCSLLREPTVHADDPNDSPVPSLPPDQELVSGPYQKRIEQHFPTPTDRNRRSNNRWSDNEVWSRMPRMALILDAIHPNDRDEALRLIPYLRVCFGDMANEAVISGYDAASTTCSVDDEVIHVCVQLDSNGGDTDSSRRRRKPSSASSSVLSSRVQEVLEQVMVAEMAARSIVDLCLQDTIEHLTLNAYSADASSSASSGLKVMVARLHAYLMAVSTVGEADLDPNTIAVLLRIRMRMLSRFGPQAFTPSERRTLWWPHKAEPSCRQLGANLCLSGLRWLVGRVCGLVLASLRSSPCFDLLRPVFLQNMVEKQFKIRDKDSREFQFDTRGAIKDENLVVVMGLRRMWPARDFRALTSTVRSQRVTMDPDAHAQWIDRWIAQVLEVVERRQRIRETFLEPQNPLCSSALTHCVHLHMLRAFLCRRRLLLDEKNKKVADQVSEDEKRGRFLLERLLQINSTTYGPDAEATITPLQLLVRYMFILPHSSAFMLKPKIVKSGTSTTTAKEEEQKDEDDDEHDQPRRRGRRRRRPRRARGTDTDSATDAGGDEVAVVKVEVQLGNLLSVLLSGLSEGVGRYHPATGLVRVQMAETQLRQLDFWKNGARPACFADFYWERKRVSGPTEEQTYNSAPDLETIQSLLTQAMQVLAASFGSLQQTHWRRRDEARRYFCGRPWIVVYCNTAVLMGELQLSIMPALADSNHASDTGIHAQLTTALQLLRDFYGGNGGRHAAGTRVICRCLSLLSLAETRAPPKAPANWDRAVSELEDAMSVTTVGFGSRDPLTQLLAEQFADVILGMRGGPAPQNKFGNTSSPGTPVLVSTAKVFAATDLNQVLVVHCSRFASTIVMKDKKSVLSRAVPILNMAQRYAMDVLRHAPDQPHNKERDPQQQPQELTHLLRITLKLAAVHRALKGVHGAMKQYKAAIDLLQQRSEKTDPEDKAESVSKSNGRDATLAMRQNKLLALEGLAACQQHLQTWKDACHSQRLLQEHRIATLSGTHPTVLQTIFYRMAFQARYLLQHEAEGDDTQDANTDTKLSDKADSNASWDALEVVQNQIVLCRELLKRLKLRKEGSKVNGNVTTHMVTGFTDYSLLLLLKRRQPPPSMDLGDHKKKKHRRRKRDKDKGKHKDRGRDHKERRQKDAKSPENVSSKRDKKSKSAREHKPKSTNTPKTEVKAKAKIKTPGAIYPDAPWLQMCLSDLLLRRRNLVKLKRQRTRRHNFLEKDHSQKEEVDAEALIENLQRHIDSGVKVIKRRGSTSEQVEEQEMRAVLEWAVGSLKGALGSGHPRTLRCMRAKVGEVDRGLGQCLIHFGVR